jgi:two-component system, LytTR family, response regulator
MKCVVIDDEPLARNGMIGYVEKTDLLTLAGSYENPLECTELLQSGTVDLLFLDIQMPYLTGIEFLKTARNLPMVILHTAYPTYALEGYQLDVIDYLVKPVAFERFFKAVSKANDFFTLRQKPATNNAAPSFTETDFFFVKCEKIFYHEILYVEALQNYSMIYTPRQKFMTLMTLKSFEESLPAETFLRTHKSFLVNRLKVESIAGNEVRIGQKMIPINQEVKKILLEKLI